MIKLSYKFITRFIIGGENMNTDKIIKEAKEVYFWGSIDKAVRELAKYKDHGDNVYFMYSGNRLYSMLDDERSCYMKVFGKTKAEVDEERRKMLEKDYREDFEERE